ncbi:MAG: SRPBCC domain-containing protein [Acidimicrobiales bacterium]|nr:SRPBCC domain-containing protein [Acidimicrobiales bacterium]
MAQELPADTPGPAGATDRPDAPRSPDGTARTAGPDGIAGTAGTDGTGHGAGLRVTRTVDIEADVDAVWQAVVDPDERALWLDDPDALARRVRVDESAPGQRLVWTWWHPGDEGDASTVAVELRPVDGGGTRVVVTETLPGLTPRGGAGAAVARGGGAASGIARRPAAAVRRAPGWLRCTADRWDRRILGLELLFVAARVATA